MKIISLNTWGGRAGKKELLSFFNKHKDDTDTFCLQEVYREGLQEIAAILPNFTPYFRPHRGNNYGLLTLVRNDIDVKLEGEIFVYKHKGYIPEDGAVDHARNIQFITIEFEGSPLTTINFHGFCNMKEKVDCEERIEQSNKIREFIKTLKGNILICGDFNLLPDTESMNILEQTGLKNLIKEYRITSTRTFYHTWPDKFADYVLISRNIGVREFKVLPDEISDHSPLLVVF